MWEQKPATFASTVAKSSTKTLMTSPSTTYRTMTEHHDEPHSLKYHLTILAAAEPPRNLFKENLLGPNIHVSDSVGQGRGLLISTHIIMIVPLRPTAISESSVLDKIYEIIGF